MGYNDINEYEDFLSSISSEIKLSNAKKIVICGVGNDIRGDDAIGPYIVDNLAKKLEEDGITELEIEDRKLLMSSKNTGEQEFYLINCGERPENFISSIAKIEPDSLIIIDAANFSGDPGDLVIEDPKKIDDMALTTHRIPLPIMLKLVNEKCDVNISSVLIGVQPKSNVLGSNMTQKVKDVSDSLVFLMYKLFERW